MNLKRTVASTLVLGALAMGAALDAHAASISTMNLSGTASITGFEDSNPLTFTADLTDLGGSVDLVALPDGNYNVSLGGSFSFLGVPLLDNIPITPVYSGALSSTGLTPGNYNFAFGGPIPFDFNFGFTINYDGNTSPQVLAALAAAGFPFVNPDGAGTLEVDGTFFANGTSAEVNFTESNLTWAGFNQILSGFDGLLGTDDGEFNGRFATNLTVIAEPIPEPGTLLLLGAGLIGLLGRRRLAKAIA